MEVLIHYMDDYYVEQLVKRIPGNKEMLIKAASIGLSAMLVISGLFLFGNGLVVGLGAIAGFMCYLLLPNLNVEFEYLYLEKELDVDRIYNMEKRKKAGEFPLEKLEIMAPLNSHSLDQYNSRIIKTYDFTSKVADAKVFALIINDGGCKKVLIEPNDALLRAIKNHFPRKVSEY